MSECSQFVARHGFAKFFIRRTLSEVEPFNQAQFGDVHTRFRRFFKEIKNQLACFFNIKMVYGEMRHGGWA